jgi:hypothetical protein
MSGERSCGACHFHGRAVCQWSVSDCGPCTGWAHWREDEILVKPCAPPRREIAQIACARHGDPGDDCVVVLGLATDKSLWRMDTWETGGHTSWSRLPDLPQE